MALEAETSRSGEGYDANDSVSGACAPAVPLNHHEMVCRVRSTSTRMKRREHVGDD